jgi:hypothetical protein
MAHVREQLRSAAVSAVTGLSTTSTRVYENRVLPLGSGLLPALCVYTRTDSPTYAGGYAMNTPMRTVELHIEGYCSGDDQSVLDDIAKEVETAIFGSGGSSLRALARVWLGDQTMSVDGEGEKVISVIDMVFRCDYATVEGAPSVAV